MLIRRVHVGWLSLALIGALSLLSLRKEAHGLGHALRLGVWSDRIAGRDPFDKDHRYLKNRAGNLREVALTLSQPGIPMLTVDRVEDGSIILLRDVPVTTEILQSVIESIKRQGYRFVTLDEMMDHLPTAGPFPRTRAKIEP